VLVTTAPACAAIALLAAIAVRTHQHPRDLLVQWFGLGTFAGSAAVLFLGQEGVGRHHAGLVVAAAYAILAVAVGLTAGVFGQAMRWAAAGEACAAGGVLTWAISAGATTVAWWASGIALVACTLLIEEHAMLPTSPWITPAVSAAMLTPLVGLSAHAASHPDGPGRTVVILLILAGEAAALAVIFSEAYLSVAAPVLAGAAWLVYAADTFHDEPNWFTVPVGVTLLVITTMIRWIRRTRGGSVTSGDVVLLEFVGMSFVVGASLGQIVVADLWYSVLAITLGFALAGWGRRHRGATPRRPHRHRAPRDTARRGGAVGPRRAHLARCRPVARPRRVRCGRDRDRHAHRAGPPGRAPPGGDPRRDHHDVGAHGWARHRRTGSHRALQDAGREGLTDHDRADMPTFATPHHHRAPPPTGWWAVVGALAVGPVVTYAMASGASSTCGAEGDPLSCTLGATVGIGLMGSCSR
jgi:hypothetical protein